MVRAKIGEDIRPHRARPTGPRYSSGRRPGLASGPRLVDTCVRALRMRPRCKVLRSSDIATRNVEQAANGRDISFYRSNERPYGVFSNLYQRTIVFEGNEYPTAEHAYQAGKPRKPAVRAWILSAPTPALVAMAAHGLYTWDIVPDWSKLKFSRMRDVLRAKFTQHDDLRALLLSTGNARLVETGRTNNAVNRLWGEVNGSGENMLGRLLMDLRSELAADDSTLTVGMRQERRRRRG